MLLSKCSKNVDYTISLTPREEDSDGQIRSAGGIPCERCFCERAL